MPNVNFRRMEIYYKDYQPSKLFVRIIHTRGSFEIVEFNQYVTKSQMSRYITRLKTKYKISDENIKLIDVDPKDTVKWVIKLKPENWK